MVTVTCKDETYACGQGREARYICVCDCGNTFTARKSSLVHKRTFSCGCERRLKYDLAGKRFGRLTVLHRSGLDERGEIAWKCKCDCGAESVVLSYYLRTGHTRSCGCLRSEMSGKPSIKEAHKRLYGIWTNMKTRCTNPNYAFYDAYGGKGVSVCDEWNAFDGFLDWALSNGYSDELTIDRMDNSRGYFPENCRWVDMQAQQNNRTNNRIMTVLGETDMMANMARRHGTPYGTIQARLQRGWNDHDAVFGREADA